jgi:ArsR family transcriptional regulator
VARPRKVDQIQERQAGEICDEQIVHVDAVRRTRAQMPEPATIADLSALFAAVGDPTRLRIVAALAGQELCVCDLAATLGMSQSAVSHQLRVLRNLGLIRPRREGRLVYYALDDDHISTLYTQALAHVRHGAKGSDQQK